MKPIRNILFASDFSKASRRAFEAATTMAKQNRARLTILYVHVPVVPLVPEQYLEGPKWIGLDRAARRWTRHQLAKLTVKAHKAGVKAKPMLVSGEPSRAIIRASRTTRADIVVVGTHGRTGFSRFLLGSVAERVVTASKCPVLTVRG